MHFKAWREGQDHNISQQVISTKDSLKNAKALYGEASNEMLALELPLSFIESVAWKHFCDKV